MFNGWILIFLVIKEWILIASVVDGPFQEMISQIESSIIVRTIFKIDDHKIRITEIGISLRIATEYRITSTFKIRVILIATKSPFSINSKKIKKISSAIEV